MQKVTPGVTDDTGGRAKRTAADIKRERFITYHEAGHAAVAVHYRLPIRLVTIVTDGTNAGHLDVLRNPLHRLDADKPNRLLVERGLRRTPSSA